MEDTTETSWFSEMGMEDPFSTDQYDIPDFFDEELYAAFGEEHVQNSLSSQCNSFSSGMIPRNNSTTSLCASSNMETPQNGIEIPAKQHKLNGGNIRAASHEQASVAPIILSFGNSNTVLEKNNPQQVIIGSMNLDDDHNSVSEVLMSRGSYTNLEEATKNFHSKKKTSGRSRPPSQTYDHILAERKRREQLSQQFVALSAIVPGLKKMDKTSVLGESIKYLKHLQEREKELEEQATMQTMESMVLVKKSQFLIEDDEESSDEQAAGCYTEQPLPEIEAKLCDKHVSLRILCEKHKGVLVKILLELEKLNLAVTNINVAPFGNLALDITIITEIRKDFNLSMKEFVRILGSTLERVKFQTA